MTGTHDPGPRPGDGDAVPDAAVPDAAPEADDGARRLRRQVVRDGVAVGLATGAYGVSFGALATAAGLSVPQACALSLLMFTGASQFALIGVASGGGGAAGGVATAVLLGARNAFYGLRLSSLLRARGLRRVVTAHLVIDESTAMAVARDEGPGTARLAFWSTGISIFVIWNLTTLVGALGAEALADPGVLGLDAAAPAAFLALLAPQARRRRPLAIAVAAAVVAVALTPLASSGVPVLVAGVVAVGAAFALGWPPEGPEGPGRDAGAAHRDPAGARDRGPADRSRERGAG